ncbi:hypothetical protein BDV25DRAFT_137880 [Aspergillus avenaceus]|uniref:Uncharacterized protein n=1 Tax=Aspergillus avenaceus TaxID=36643 RepID=A0A5N6U2H3_ASPAV|nr:hypothetical protein BDV25DRAFT_137880 [Aspergillus avenaceus]
MPIAWTAEADAKLLVAIISTSKMKIDLKAVAAFMGPECTVSSVQHRINRIKDKVKDPNAASSAEASPEKPRKRGRPARLAGEVPAPKKAKAE